MIVRPSHLFRFPLACTLGAIALSLLFFSPRLWLMQTYMPGTAQWDRAHTFLLQCESPFRRDIEPAMLWRLLPPIICHALGLKGWYSFILPWLGIFSAVFYVARLNLERLRDKRAAFGGTLLFATTSAVLAPSGWLGLNDGWVWLGLIAVAFARSGWTLFAAALFCPWVDERFIIGLSLALLVRQIDLKRATMSVVLPLLPGLIVYTLLRTVFFSTTSATASTVQFLHASLSQSLLLIPWAPLGWWMGLRVAWLPVAYILKSHPWLLGGITVITLGVCLLLASDLSRSAAILTPLVLLGMFNFSVEYPLWAPRAIPMAAIANLLIPAAHITYTKFDLINNFIIEMIRLFRT